MIRLPTGIVRIAAAQTPEFREDVDGALMHVVELSARAEAAGAVLLCLPEGFLQGYLTEYGPARRHAFDLSSPDFSAVLDRFPKAGPTLVIGLIEVDQDRLFNTAAVIRHGVLVGSYRKRHLLDGERIFCAGTDCPVFEVGGLRFGINICYDTNFPDAAQRVGAQRASLIVCPANNMSRRPTAELLRDRHNAIRGERCRETGMWMVSSDVTGERDGRVSWGPTAMLTPAGDVAAQLPLGRPGLLLFDMPLVDYP